MANNITVKDASAASVTVKTTDSGGTHTPHHNVDASALPTGAATSAKQDTQITAEQAIQTAVEILDDWDESDRAKVNIVAGQAGITAGAGAVGASTPRVTLASDDPAVALLTTIDGDTGTLAGAVSGTEVQVDVVAALPAGTNAIGKLAANSGVDIGDVDVTSISAGSNLIGDVGIQARTSGGLSIARDLDLDETELEVKASAGQLFGWYIYNDGAADVSVKLYNATAANVTVGTTTPVMTLTIPAGSAANILSPIGIVFDTAICAAAVTEIADNGTTAPAANQVVANFFYK
jgi:hypothetical protein